MTRSCNSEIVGFSFSALLKAITLNSQLATPKCQDSRRFLVGRRASGVVALLCVASIALAQMPDPRAMSGIPMPSADLPDGTVTVRVVRGAITNNLTGVEVELHGAGAVRRASTGPDGRAQFANVPAGATVHAVTTVDGERVASKEFQMPARGGVRTLLAMGEPSTTPAPGESVAPRPASATLSIGQNSRIAIEFAEDVLQVFYLLEILNRSTTAVNPAPLVFEMPPDAQGTTVLEGSSPQATAQGSRVTLRGPLAPGVTTVQMAYRLASNRDAITIRQSFPLAIDMVLVAVQKVDSLRVASPQLSRTQEVPIQNTTFIMGTGPVLASGTPLELRLDGLPHHSRAPVWLALGLAIAIVGIAVWLSVHGGNDAVVLKRRQLEQGREQGLSMLAELEAQRRSGGVDEREYASRRAGLIEDLERIYGELDAAAGTADRGAAA